MGGIIDKGHHDLTCISIAGVEKEITAPKMLDFFDFTVFVIVIGVV